MGARSGQAITGRGPSRLHHHSGRENKQMGHVILHGNLHGRLNRGDSRRHESSLATRLSQPRSGWRSVPGIFRMAFAAATRLRGDSRRRSGLSRGALAVISWERGATRAITAAGLSGENGQAERLDTAIRAAAVKMRTAGEQRHDRCQPYRPRLDCAKNHTYYISSRSHTASRCGGLARHSDPKLRMVR